MLSNISVEEEITISISEAKGEHINDLQRENIPDGAVVVDVRIMAGDKDIGKSLGGLITISIRYTPLTVRSAWRITSMTMVTR